MGDHVFLKVMPKRGVFRFSKRGKLSSRYIGPLEVLEREGIVSYQLALPPSLSSVHDVFHVSMLRKYTPCDPLATDAAVTPQTRGSVDYPSTRGIQVDVGLPDATS